MAPFGGKCSGAMPTDGRHHGRMGWGLSSTAKSGSGEAGR